MKYDTTGQSAAVNSAWLANGKTLRTYKPKCSGVCAECSKPICSASHYVYLRKLGELRKQGKSTSQHFSVDEFDRLLKKVEI